MLEERNQARRHGHQLFGRDIHEIHARAFDIHEIAAAPAHDAVLLKLAFVVHGRIRLGDAINFLAIGGEVIDFFGHLPGLHPAVRSFEEAEIIDAGKGRQRGDQADVRAFGSLHRANASVMRRMHVADFEARAIARQPAWPKRRKPAFVGQFRQRINLIHELRQLAAAKEIANHGRKRLRIDQLLGRHRLDALIKQRHALLDEAFGAGQTHAALIGEQFAHGAHATAAEMVNVIQGTFALFEAETD